MSSLRAEPLLDAADLAIPALDAARLLLGCALIRDEIVLRITEVEAYCWPDDTANHCRMGRTERNAPMWGPAGRAYVYLCYGIHPMLNVVCGSPGEGTAVLVRAGELVEGHDQVAARRGGRTGPEALAGPGRLGAALALNPTWSHHDLCAPGGLELRRGPAVTTLLAGPRIGIGYASAADQAAPWRLAAADCAWVSHRKPLRPAT